MKKRYQRFQTWMLENAYWITIGCVLVMVVGCALYTQSLRAQQDVRAAAQAPEIEESLQPTATPAPTPLPTIAPLNVRPAALVQRGGMWPVSGSVMRAFDAQESVYWETLGVWRTHHGLDIGARTGESVSACMDGRVADAVWDLLWGWQVSIAHDDGCEMRYAGLESCAVHEGQQIRRGQVIGVVMERIPCEAEMETHLHLEMRKDGRDQDPEAVLTER